MECFPILFALLVFFSLLIIIIIIIIRSAAMAKRKPQPRNLPPGPPSLPIVGNLSQLRAPPHRSFRALSEIYGPVVYLKLGQLPTVVVSSAETAKEVLKTQDLAFCTRPPLSGLRKIYYGGLDIAFTPYNAYWRQARKICTSELLSSSRIQLLKWIREEEVGILVKSIGAHSAASGLVNLSEMFLCLLNNITCREVFGKRLAEEGRCGRSRFHELVTEWTSLMGHFNIGEYFPSMEWLNLLTGMHGRFKKNFLDIDAFLDKVIDAHLAEQRKGIQLEHEYIIGVLLRLQEDPTMEIPLTRDHIKAILMDLFIAGTDTAAIALEWGMSELMRNPQVRKKAQHEVRTMMGSKEMVEESDLDKLEYLKLVVKEILRLHPPAAFLLPRESRRDCNVHGYDIPANTRVMINVWAIGRDPKSWDRPDEFLPERFEDSGVDYKGRHFQFLPFGSGRRGCPGISLGAVVVELALANLLHVFDWYMPHGMKEEELDMGESFGIVIRRKSPLFLAAIPHGKA